MRFRRILSACRPSSAGAVAAIMFLVASPGTSAIAQAPASRPASVTSNALRQEVEALSVAMVAAFKSNPASVARFYADDARIMGGGGNFTGRAEIDGYWAGATMFTDWALEVTEVGGSAESPWVLGRSTLTGASGRTMVTNFVGILRRGGDGTLKYHIDMYTMAGPSR